MDLKQTIADSLKINKEYGAGVYKSPDGILEVTYLPDEKVGYIDIKNPKNLKFAELTKKAKAYLANLPEGKWEFNPDTAQKGRIYRDRIFKGVGTVKTNPDMPNNALIFDNRTTMATTFKPDADGFIHITKDQQPALKKFLFDKIANNPKGKFSRTGLGIFNRIVINGELRDLRSKTQGANKTNIDAWQFDRVSQKDAALAKRNALIKKGTLTLEEFQEQANLFFQEKGVDKYKFNGKSYTADQFATAKHKEYKRGLAQRKKQIKNLAPKQLQELGITDPKATLGHINAPGGDKFIESQFNLFPEQGTGSGGNFGNQNQVRRSSLLKALGLNVSREEFIQRSFTDTHPKYSMQRINRVLSNPRVNLGTALRNKSLQIAGNPYAQSSALAIFNPQTFHAAGLATQKGVTPDIAIQAAKGIGKDLLGQGLAIGLAKAAGTQIAGPVAAALSTPLIAGPSILYGAHQGLNAFTEGRTGGLDTHDVSKLNQQKHDLMIQQGDLTKWDLRRRARRGDTSANYTIDELRKLAPEYLQQKEADKKNRMKLTIN